MTLRFKYFFIIVFFIVFKGYTQGVDLKIGTLLSKSGVLYVGIDNVLTFNNELKCPIGCTFTVDNGYVFNDDRRVVLIPSNSGNATLTVTKIDELNVKQSKEFRFIVLRYPTPMLKLDSIIVSDNESISKSLLLNSVRFELGFNSDIIEDEGLFKISSINFGYKYGNNYLQMQAPNNILNNEIKNTINKIAPGTDITIRLTLESNDLSVEKRPIFRFKLID